MKINTEMLAYLIISIHKNIQRCKAYAVEDKKLEMSHAICIYYISKLKDGLGRSALCSETGYDKAAISRSIADLEKMKLVKMKKTREGSTYKALLMLTGKGAECRASIDRIFTSTAEESIRGFSENELKALIRGLIRLNNAFNSYIEENLENGRELLPSDAASSL